VDNAVRRCFLLMPFDEGLDWLRLDVEAAGNAAGFVVMRADDVFKPGSLLQQILESIDEADVIVCVCTSRNANVFFELGYAWRRHEPVLLAESIEDLPSDFRHHRALVYGPPTPALDHSALRSKLAEFMVASAAQRRSQAALEVEGRITSLASELNALRQTPEPMPQAVPWRLAPGALDEPGTQPVPTGFHELDRLLGGGLKPGRVTALFGRAGVGKSILALNLVRSAASSGRPCVLFSLDDDRDQVTRRLVSASAKVPLSRLLGPSASWGLDENQRASVARAMTQIAQSPLYIDDSPDISLSGIEAKVAELSSTQPVDLVVIDRVESLLDLAKGDVGGRNIGRRIKRLSRRLNISIVAVTEPSPVTADSFERRLAISAAMNTMLAGHSDVVLLLHRDDQYEPESPRAGEADLHVLQHRDGPTSTITVAFQGHYARFVDMLAW